jgi:hypothetical protein
MTVPESRHVLTRNERVLVDVEDQGPGFDVDRVPDPQPGAPLWARPVVDAVVCDVGGLQPLRFARPPVQAPLCIKVRGGSGEYLLSTGPQKCYGEPPK